MTGKSQSGKERTSDSANSGIHAFAETAVHDKVGTRTHDVEKGAPWLFIVLAVYLIDICFHSVVEPFHYNLRFLILYFVRNAQLKILIQELIHLFLDNHFAELS